jgi:Fe2+ or Zn2+ uptake regulation protein
MVVHKTFSGLYQSDTHLSLSTMIDALRQKTVTVDLTQLYVHLNTSQKHV